MRIVKVGVLAPTNKGIPLGVQGENRAAEVEFDTRPWFSEYPGGTVSAVARRDGDPAPYPLTLDVEDGTAVWLVSDTDTAKAGEGAVELTMTSAGTRVRSLTFKTLVTASLTDSPVDDDAWYGWLDKAVVKVDETVQAAQRKMAEVDDEWTGLKADVTSKVEECGNVAAQASSDAHHAKVDAQAVAKVLESAEGSVAKAEAAAKRAVDAMLDADDSAVEASRSALSAGESAESAAGSATNAARSASEAATSASNAADAASAASGSASAAEQSAADASNAKTAAQTAMAEAEAAKSEAATSASSAADSATDAAKSASDAAASVGSINVVAPKTVEVAANSSGYKALSIGDTANSDGQGSVAIGYKASSSGSESIAIGNTANARMPFDVALGELADANAGGSIALGYNSKTDKVNEFSIGNNNLTRELTHVSEPTSPSSASTKKYTDDNDAKTLAEAKKYTDDNTTNALTGTVSGKLLHVEDAWPSKPMSLTIDGAYKQDGTPSPESPVPITVIENPVLHVNGRNFVNVPNKTVAANSDGDMIDCGLIPANTTAYLSFTSSVEAVSTHHDAAACSLTSGDNAKNAYNLYDKIHKGANKTTLTPDFDASKHLTIFGYRRPTSAFDLSNYQLEVGGYHDYRAYTSVTLPITLPAEHPYLAALPDGTHDEIVIDKNGNVTLVARVGKLVFDNQEKFWAIQVQPGGFALGYSDNLLTENSLKKNVRDNVLSDRFKAKRTWINAPSVGVSGVLWVVPKQNDGNITKRDIVDAVAGSCLYAPLVEEAVYQLGKLDIPALPETISNVWTNAELTTNMSMTYKRDINIAFGNLVQAVVAAAAGE